MSNDILAGLTAQHSGLRKVSKGAFYVRDLEAQDLEGLSEDHKMVSGEYQISQLRTAHHIVARLVAEGKLDTDIAAITGRTPMSLRQLRGNPAFQELVAHYSKKLDEVYLGVHTRVATLATTAVEMLQERLEESPEGFSNKELRNLMESTLDRSVAPSQAGVPQDPQGRREAAQAEVDALFKPRTRGVTLDGEAHNPGPEGAPEKFLRLAGGTEVSDAGQVPCGEREGPGQPSDQSGADEQGD